MININRNTLYSCGSYRYKNFVELSNEELMMVLDWRNNESIRKFMYNRNRISLQSHMAYINSLKEKNDRFYWLVYRIEEPIGVVDLTSIDYNDAKAEFGYYMSPKKKNSGIGLDFVYNSLQFVFSIGIEELYGNVNVDNKSALLLDEYLGCRFAYNEQYKENEIMYVPWICTKKDFLDEAEHKNNLRAYYLYIKARL